MVALQRTMISRRTFLAAGIGLSGVASILDSCQQDKKIRGTLSGPAAAVGHRLRDGHFPSPTLSVKTEVVIVGGGIAGLSAARVLQKAGTDFRLLELEQQVGGNSSYGKNDTSSYPLGAHYLPIPSLSNKHLLEFLAECGVITGYENNKPVYNEYHLCFEPKERLFINNHWQAGLVPHDGLPSQDLKEMDQLHELLNYFRELKGADGRHAFTIPLSACSSDPEILRLDHVTFGDFVKSKGLHSPFLLWYLNYCCADDFGGTIGNVSAWAGIHYFASRKGIGANADGDTVLTWPEGNGWLMDKLKVHAVAHTQSNSLVYRVQMNPQGVDVDYWDVVKGESIRIQAAKVILATPQFVNRRLLPPDSHRPLDYNQFHYAPWMIANLTCNATLSERRGETLAWDNVVYGSQSLGYVNANHQDIHMNPGKRVITYYHAMTGNDAAAARNIAQRRTLDDWMDMIWKDLSGPHPELKESIESADVWIWGHGMIRPSVSFRTQITPEAERPLNDRIYFAHSDISGISIFEEAFHRGSFAAQQVLS